MYLEIGAPLAAVGITNYFRRAFSPSYTGMIDGHLILFNNSPPPRSFELPTTDYNNPLIYEYAFSYRYTIDVPHFTQTPAGGIQNYITHYINVFEKLTYFIMTPVMITYFLGNYFTKTNVYL
jgi:hypothetical protein